MKRVVIIGSGNLAEALARAVAESNLQLVQIYARNAERARAVATLAATRWTTQPAELADADIYLVAVSDRAVAEVAAVLPLPAHACVAHTAGSVPLDVLPGRCAHRAVFYPMQTSRRGAASTSLRFRSSWSATTRPSIPNWRPLRGSFRRR